ncbi:hypothetical protein E3N88_41503 [Mikania micrantha]|uniref:Uncharacterized protein n=1 Tax=Mikania micrantha TaxID=192012 RepID=A0A5N6LKF5_9ASTR|nr:hypothetical protein E3N88_41503 [Mikania micrantha]
MTSSTPFMSTGKSCLTNLPSSSHNARKKNRCMSPIRMSELTEDEQFNLRESTKDVFTCVSKVVYTVEFQKHGLPHAHICLFMDKDHKCPTVDHIDQFISAEIPDRSVDPDLYSLVREFMIHGPCGADNMNCPCMVDRKCSKNFPKKFYTHTSIDTGGFPIYKRRDSGYFVEKSGVKLDNRSVVAYNKVLLKRYQAHINVEWCNQSGSIKYLFKYINKGPDRATISLVDSTTTNDQVNLTSFVTRLPFHLPGQQQIVYGAEDDIDIVLNKSTVASSMFLSWMMCNETYEYARIHSVPPSLGEAYFLRILLNKVKGPKSFDDILTVNGLKCPTFRNACYAMGLLDDDTEYIEDIQEVSHTGTGYYIRSLFAIMLMSNSLSKPDFVWENTWKYLSDDILYRQQKLLKYPEWLLDIEEGKVGGLNNNEGLIEVPNDLLIADSLDPISDLIDFVYPSILQNFKNPNFFQERAILAPKNNVVEGINDRLMSMFPGDDMEYLSSDSIC